MSLGKWLIKDKWNAMVILMCNCDVQKDLTERYVKMNEELKQTKVNMTCYLQNWFV